jgi:hypothetical protein
MRTASKKKIQANPPGAKTPGGVPGAAGPAGQAKKPAEPERNLVDTAHDVFVKLRDAEATAIHKRLAKQTIPWGVGAAVAGSALLGIPMKEPASIIAGGLADAAIIAGLYLPAALKTSFASAMARWAREHPFHTVLCGIAAWVWYTAAVILGVGSAPELMTVGLAGMYLLAARWWNVHRLGYPGDEEIREVKEGIKEIIEDVKDELEEVVGAADNIVEKWDKKLAHDGGVLSGARLRDREEHPAGQAYALHIVPGKQTIESVMNAMPLISTGLGVPQRNLLVEERQPTDDDPEPDPAILKFQVITKSPIRNTVPLEGPRWRWNGDDLIVDMGPFADGIDQAPWRLFSQNSLWGGFVGGSQGSGKSSLIDAMAISFMDTGLVSVIYVDPQDGSSSPGLFECAEWAIGSDKDQQENLLIGLESLVRFRAMENSVRLHVSGFTPSRERPGFLVIIDECHAAFTKENATRWGLVARVGRKVGVAILGASQIYGLDSFGGDDALRQSLETANSAILRIGKNQASLIPGTTLDPSRLPQIAGYGVIRATDPKYNRSAPFRGPYAKDEVRMAMMRAAAKKQPYPDALAIGALDNDTERAFSRRHEIFVESQERMEAELQMLEAGMSVAVPKPEPMASGPMGPAIEAIEGEYISVPTVHGLDGVKKVIFEGIATGTTDTAGLLDLCKIMGFTSESWFFEALNELQDLKLIKSAKKGIYELGAA